MKGVEKDAKGINLIDQRIRKEGGSLVAEGRARLRKIVVVKVLVNNQGYMNRADLAHSKRLCRIGLVSLPHCCL